MNTLKKITVVSSLLLGAITFAQETEQTSKTTISGAVDAYTKYDVSGRDNSKTSFTKTQNSYELNMASIKAEHEIGKVSAVIDLGFGKKAEEFAYNEKKTNLAIKQAYLSYEAIDNLTLTAGTFGTHIGYELLDAQFNKNYSMSYAFSYGPFLNTGAKANYVLDEYNFMLGLTLPTDYRSASGTKTIIGQVGYATEERSIYFNFTTGEGFANKIRTTQLDLVVNEKITDKLSAGLNATYHLQKANNSIKTNTWYSTVLYVGYDVKENISINYRGEVFGDKGGLNIKTHVLSNTLSANYKIKNFTITPELRGDLGQSKIFLDRDGMATKVSAYALIGGTYTF